MLAIFVRPHSSLEAKAGAEQSVDDVVALLPADLRAQKGDPEPLVSRLKEGPFLPLSQALTRDARLTDDLAKAFSVPSLGRYGRFRRWLWLALIAVLVLMELERELLAAGVAGIGRRLAVDTFFFALVSIDLARPVPRMSRVTALVMLAITVRYADMAARACGEHRMLIPLGALTLAGAIGLLTMSPSRQKLRDEVFAKVLPHRRLPTSRSPLDRGAIGGALLVGTGLPLVLLAARAAHLGALVQGAMLIAWALAAPRLFERVMGTSASPGAIGSRGWTLLSAVAAGLGVTIALAHASHYGIGLFAHATQCLDSAGFEHGLAQRILESQTVNASQDLAGVRSKWLYIAMTVCVIPLAEERVFRDVLQRVLVRSFGKRRGVASAAALFGLAHLGVYGAATFDAVLLGVGFGVAYEEAGLVASTLTHALWNLYWLS